MLKVTAYVCQLEAEGLFAYTAALNMTLQIGIFSPLPNSITALMDACYLTVVVDVFENPCKLSEYVFRAILMSYD